jgi:hypothetical protein
MEIQTELKDIILNESKIITDVNDPRMLEPKEDLASKNLMEKYTSVDRLKKQDKDWRMREYLKCKMSALYFVKNYIRVQVPGGIITVGESDEWLKTPKYSQFIKLIQGVDNVAMMASRQHYKTTTVAQYLLWVMLFHPKVRVEFLTLKQKSALDFVERMYSMLSLLPKWLEVPKSNKGEKQTYLELANGSRLNSNYVSGAINPDTVGRGMTAPVIYIDEAAFIPHMDIVWGSLQPVVSKARVLAKQNNFPTNVIMTTTPNGSNGNFFYDLWQNSWDFSEVWDDTINRPVKNHEEVLNSHDFRNNFAKLELHWSETGKDDEWFKKQQKELQFNTRRINQELNLVFLGSNSAVFPDEVLEKFVPKTPKFYLDLAYGEKIAIFEDLDPNRQYLMGVDNAASTAAKSDFSTMVLTDAETGRQVGEYRGKFNVIKRYANVVKSTILQLGIVCGLTPKSLQVIVERNSFGIGIIEEILFSEPPKNFKYEFEEFLHFTKTKSTGDRVPGIMTNKTNREQMFNLLLSVLNTDPTLAQGKDLQNELRTLEQKTSGRFEASSGKHDDLIMAYNFTLWLRHDMIQEGDLMTEDTPEGLKITQGEINSYLDVTFSTMDYNFKNDAKLISTKDLDNPKVIPNHYTNEDEAKFRRKEILKDFAIPGYTQPPDEDDEYYMEDYQIF